MPKTQFPGFPDPSRKNLGPQKVFQKSDKNDPEARSWTHATTTPRGELNEANARVSGVKTAYHEASENDAQNDGFRREKRTRGASPRMPGKLLTKSASIT